MTDNPFLNHRSPDPRGGGYCVFGRVISGTEVVDAVTQTPTRTMGRMANVPATPVVIHKAELLLFPPADPAGKEGG
ncbi:MAG: peptidylprolyl isomerase [Desulfosudaceae bacterium]